MNLSDRTPGADAAEWAGRLLVVLQFGLLALLGVLLAKAALEERALARRFPDYRDYRDYRLRTTRFLPWLV